MPYKPHTVTKKYYSVAEVAEIISARVGQRISAWSLRNYESQGLIKRPLTRKHDSRRYTAAEIEDAILAVSLVLVVGYTTQGAINLLKTKAVEDIREFHQLD